MLNFLAFPSFEASFDSTLNRQQFPANLRQIAESELRHPNDGTVLPAGDGLEAVTPDPKATLRRLTRPKYLPTNRLPTVRSERPAIGMHHALHGNAGWAGTRMNRFRNSPFGGEFAMQAELYLMASILVVAGLAGGLTVVLLGFLLPRRSCPDCGVSLPRFRMPQSTRQALWGGWTCPKCCAEIDRVGAKRKA